MVLSDPDLTSNCCENNCDSYISRFGGTKIEGVYVLKHRHLSLYQLIRHFIIFDGKDYIDITPFDDARNTNWFIPVKIKLPNTYIKSLACINKQVIEVADTMFYVYCYIDPTTNKPMYVGKGKQNRAFDHIKYAKKERKNKNNTRFLNKLKSLYQAGTEPRVIFLAQNIADEKTAYEIEESFIQQFGRQGYDSGGTLLNICEGGRPPNHKGKTYEDIYGDRAEAQRLNRHNLQLSAGGWFRGKKHTDEMKRKHSIRFSGSNNPSFGKECKESTRLKISKATKGKKRPHMSYMVCVTNNITGNKYHILYSELGDFCAQHNLSKSTLGNQLYLGWGVCKKGKTKGWYIERIPSGVVNQDVTTDTFKGFSL